jgi:hypothetical protein
VAGCLLPWLRHKAGSRKWRTPLADKDEGLRRALSLKPSQRPQLVAEQRVCAGSAILDPPHVQHRGIELDLIPTQVAELGRPQPVPEG